MNSQSESVPYEYPDRNDSITFQMISQIEPLSELLGFE